GRAGVTADYRATPAVVDGVAHAGQRDDLPIVRIVHGDRAVHLEVTVGATVVRHAHAVVEGGCAAVGDVLGPVAHHVLRDAPLERAREGRGRGLVDGEVLADADCNRLAGGILCFAIAGRERGGVRVRGAGATRVSERQRVRERLGAGVGV